MAFLSKKTKVEKKSKRKNKNTEINVNENNIKDGTETLNKGNRTLKDMIAPPSFDRSNEDYIKVGDKYVRNFFMKGFPADISIGWLDKLYSYDGYMDTAVYINPADDRKAIDELTMQITKKEAQRDNEIKKGFTKNYDKFSREISRLEDERAKLQDSRESLFYLQITSNLYSDSKEELDTETKLLDNNLKGARIHLMPTLLRQDDGYKSALPFGNSYIKDMIRNFNTGAASACFPFYNAEICHKNGVFIGLNMTTNSPVMIDFFDRKELPNGNMTVFGTSGAGKTFYVSLLTMRSTLRGVQTLVIDPENEYKKLTESLGGAYIDISPESKHKINPFDIGIDDVLDDNEQPTGEREIRIKDKVADLLNLIGVMGKNPGPEEISISSTLLQELYTERGITSNPDSLKTTEQEYDVETGEFYPAGRLKKMPRFSDFYAKLIDYATKEQNQKLMNLSYRLKMFTKGEIYDLFDCYTSENLGLDDLKKANIITFNISNLEESILRPIGMYIVMSWAWEKWAKKDLKTKKRILCDEAWMLLNRNMEGHEFTSKFLEVTARRIRKRNGGLLCVSQNFKEFADNPQGQAVLTNSYVNIFLQQNSADKDRLQDIFNLSDGEINFLMSANKGEALIKFKDDKVISKTIPFEYERKLIEKKKE